MFNPIKLFSQWRINKAQLKIDWCNDHIEWMHKAFLRNANIGLPYAIEIKNLGRIIAAKNTEINFWRKFIQPTHSDR